MNSKLLKDKKIALIIAFQDFRDEEYFIPKNIFLNEGANVLTASSKKGKAIGSFGGTVDIDLTIDEVNVLDFDAVLFIGGSGAAKYMNDKICHQIAKETVSGEKILGAICIAPTILARSGVLKEKKATVWSSTLDKSAVKVLKEEGANYQTDQVVIDDNIVTASGSSVSRKFAETVVRLLTKM